MLDAPQLVGLATLVAAIAAAFVSVYNAIKLKTVEKDVNGKMSVLIEEARKEGYQRAWAEAHLEARRTAARPPPPAI